MPKSMIMVLRVESIGAEFPHGCAVGNVAKSLKWAPLSEQSEGGVSYIWRSFAGAHILLGSSSHSVCFLPFHLAPAGKKGYN